MSRRIDIELTSALADGSWTWRAAGARKPNGVVDNSILPAGSAVGDLLKVEVEQMLDGIEVQSVVKGRDKVDDASVLALLPSDRPFEAVIETRAKRDRSDRGDRGDRGGRDGRGNRDGRNKRDGRSGDGRSGDGRSGEGRSGEGRSGEGKSGDGGRRNEPRRPHFEAPPEIPLRPKPKRLRPGKARRNEVLAALPEEQRAIAELALQGIPAVRARVKEDNLKLAAEGKPTMPETGVVKMAEDLLPKLRVAEWLDRAEAAQRQMEHLDLRDLRSIVAASDDSNVARDESARELADVLRASLLRKQDEELLLWFGDIDAAVEVGRVIRALRLSSQPPKAGVMFPPALARRLSEAATAALLPDDPADRWIAVLEATAFSPVRTLVVPTVAPTTITDDLRATTLRLGPALPQIAALLGVEVPAGAPKPKPLRQQPARKDSKKGLRKDSRNDSRNESPKGPVADGARRSEPTESPEPEAAASAEPVTNVDSVPTAEPVESSEPAAPTEAVAPVESAEPVETVAPAESAEPVEAVAPAESAEPVETVAPVDVSDTVEISDT